MSVSQSLGLERNGEGGGVSVALRMLIILLFLGSVLGEGGNWEKLDLVSSSINSFTQN